MAIICARVAPKRDTTENWEAHYEFIPFRGEIIIYTDYMQRQVDGEMVNIAGLKIGDGVTAIGDLPFVNNVYEGGSGATATINGVLIEGDLSLGDLEIQPAGDYPDQEITNEEIDALFGIPNDTQDIERQIEESDYIQLTKDEEIEEVIDINHDVTIDLAGHTISSEYSEPIFLVTEGTLTLTGEGAITGYRIAETRDNGKIVVENGTYTASNACFFIDGEGAKLTLNDGTLHGMLGGIGVLDGGEAEINGGKITVEDNYCLFTNSAYGRGGNTITLNDGVLVADTHTEGYESAGVYIANSDTFVMNGGAIASTNGCGILMRAGNVTLNGGNVETRGTGEGGYVSDDRYVMDHSAVIYHEQTDYPGKEGMSLTITGGSYTGVEHSVSVLSDEIEPNVVVTGGDFIPHYPEE